MPLSRPGSITAAAVLWIIYGSLSLLGNLMTLAASHGRTGTSSIFGFAMALAFLITGIQALGGRAKGLLGAGIASIILGAIVLLAFLALGSLVRGMHAPAALLAVIGLLAGGLLITPGILACAGNGKYKAWRQSRGMY